MSSRKRKGSHISLSTVKKKRSSKEKITELKEENDQLKAEILSLQTQLARAKSPRVLTTSKKSKGRAPNSRTRNPLVRNSKDMISRSSDRPEPIMIQKRVSRSNTSPAGIDLQDEKRTPNLSLSIDGATLPSNIIVRRVESDDIKQLINLQSRQVNGTLLDENNLLVSEETYSSSSRYSQPEDEQELFDDVFGDDPGYLADEISENVTAETRTPRAIYSIANSSLDLQEFVKELKNIHNYVENHHKNYKDKETSKIMKSIESMENQLALALFARARKGRGSRGEEKYGKLVNLNTSPYFNNPKTLLGIKSSPVTNRNQHEEIVIRVDQTSLLNPNSSKDLVNDYKNIGGNDNRSSKRLGRSTSMNLRDSCKDLISAAPTSQPNEDSQQRYLTFIIQDNGKKILKQGHILDILEWIINNDCSSYEMDTFLFCFRTATNPTLLLNTLTILYKFSFHPKRSQQIVKLLKLWIRKYYVIDFHTDSILSQKLWEFVNNNIPSQKKTLRKYSRSWQNLHWDLVKERLDVGGFSFTGKFSLLDQDPREIAEQLTIIEWEYFKHFNILDCFCDDKPETPDTERIVEQFNRVSGWVASTILKGTKPKKRALYIKFFISVAKNLLELKNFNGLMEITSALDSISIGRLKKTWKVMQTTYLQSFEQLSKLNSIMSPKENYKDYRALLDEIDPPCVPFFGVISRDITMINVGNKTFIKSMINFEKCRSIWKMCSRILRIQKVGYSQLHTIPVIHSFLVNAPIPDEQDLYDLSIQLEPITSISLSSPVK